MGLKQHDFQGKKVHIIGMMRSGCAAAEVLASLGASVTLHDEKNSPDIQDTIHTAQGIGLEMRIGYEAYEGIGTADMIIASPGVPETSKGLIIAKERNIPVLSEIELAYRISLAPILAITGTNGKTTTTALLGDILKRQGRENYIAGNIVAGDIRLTLSRAAFRASASELIVAEISSFQLERISEFHPKVGALLNVSADHLNRHSDLEDYARTKARVFENQGLEDHAILNADDPLVMQFAPQIKSKIWLFGHESKIERGIFRRGSEVWAKSSSGEEFVCDTSTMKLRGSHNVENIMAAAAILLAMEFGYEYVQEAVDAFEPLEHRLEPVVEVQGIEFINNSMCTNMLAALRSLEAIGKPAVLIAGGKGKGDDYTSLGEAFKKYAKHVVLIGDDAARIDEVVRKAGFDKLSHALSMEEAVEVAWRHAESGDSIVLSPGCASHDMFRNFEHRGKAYKAAVMVLAQRFGAK